MQTNAIGLSGLAEVDLGQLTRGGAEQSTWSSRAARQVSPRALRPVPAYPAIKMFRPGAAAAWSQVPRHAPWRVHPSATARTCA
jgi:hypothetical protein